MYAKGLTTRQISSVIYDIYGFEVSDGMVSNITDKIMPQIEKWQKANVYIYNVRGLRNEVIEKKKM